MDIQNKQEELKVATVAKEALDAKKALDISVLEVGGKTVLADYFVIATGTSGTHVNALADEVEFQLKDQLSISPQHIEGKENWILMDYGYLIVHIFTEESRKFYNLEKLWNDAESIDI